MFDLPVGNRTERKVASRFRQDLLDLGFEMSQFSVYLRFCGTQERTAVIEKKVKERLPEWGTVSLLYFTDRQFANTQTFINSKSTGKNRAPEQLLLV